jgi:hypothetical protein
MLQLVIIANKVHDYCQLVHMGMPWHGQLGLLQIKPAYKLKRCVMGIGTFAT